MEVVGGPGDTWFPFKSDLVATILGSTEGFTLRPWITRLLQANEGAWLGYWSQIISIWYGILPRNNLCPEMPPWPSLGFPRAVLSPEISLPSPPSFPPSFDKHHTWISPGALSSYFCSLSFLFLPYSLQGIFPIISLHCYLQCLILRKQELIHLG